MAKVTADTSGVTIKISDPVEMERVLTVLLRSNSTKVAALRQAIGNALLDVMVTPEVVDSVVSSFEKLLETE